MEDKCQSGEAGTCCVKLLGGREFSLDQGGEQAEATPGGLPC